MLIKLFYRFLLLPIFILFITGCQGKLTLLQAVKTGKIIQVKKSIKLGHNINQKDKNKNSLLYLAVQNGFIEIAKFLFKKGANPNIANKEGITPFQMMVKEGQLQLIKIALKKGAKVNAQDIYGWTALHWAVLKKSDEVIRLLLQNGARINSATFFKKRTSKSHWSWHFLGYTPLHVAVQTGSDEIIKLLLAMGANPALQCALGNTPLHYLSDLIRIKTRNKKSPLVRVIKIILSKGADIDKKNKVGETPLHRLVNASGLKEIVDKPYVYLSLKGKKIEYSLDYIIQALRIMIAKGGNLNAKNNSGQSVLFKSDLLKVSRFLIENGANIKVKDNRGLTIIHQASALGNRPLVEILLDKGMSVNILSQDGRTPLHLAAASILNFDMVKFLIEKKADITIKDKSGRTPLYIFLKKYKAITLHWWAGIGDVEKIKAIINSETQKINASLSGKYEGFTPLHLAVMHGRVDVVEMLLKAGAKVNASGKDGYTALHMAAQKGFIKIALLLLNHKANPEAKTKQGNHIDWTPLHFAAVHNKPDMVRLLVRKGAFVNARSHTGFTPLKWANIKGHKKMVEVLKKYGGEE